MQINATSTKTYCDLYGDPTGVIPSAVQVDTINPNQTLCYWLGMEVKNLPEYTMELLDPNDAGKGVVYTILNGEYCAEYQRNRELRIKLECPDDSRIEHVEGGFSDSTVTEIEKCIYELSYITPVACPVCYIYILALHIY